MQKNIKKVIISLLALNLILSSNLSFNNKKDNLLIYNVKANDSHPSVSVDNIIWGDNDITIPLPDNHTLIKEIKVQIDSRTATLENKNTSALTEDDIHWEVKQDDAGTIFNAGTNIYDKNTRKIKFGSTSFGGQSATSVVGATLTFTTVYLDTQEVQTEKTVLHPIREAEKDPSGKYKEAPAQGYKYRLKFTIDPNKGTINDPSEFDLSDIKSGSLTIAFSIQNLTNGTYSQTGKLPSANLNKGYKLAAENSGFNKKLSTRVSSTPFEVSFVVVPKDVILPKEDTKIAVENINSLKDEEKRQIIAEIEKLNKENLPDGTTYEITADNKLKINFPHGDPAVEKELGDIATQKEKSITPNSVSYSFDKASKKDKIAIEMPQPKKGDKITIYNKEKSDDPNKSFNPVVITLDDNIVYEDGKLLIEVENLPINTNLSVNFEKVDSLKSDPIEFTVAPSADKGKLETLVNSLINEELDENTTNAYQNAQQLINSINDINTKNPSNKDISETLSTLENAFKAMNDQKLANKKAEALTKLEDFESLTEDEIEAFTQEINDESDINNIDSIITKASNQNDLNDARNQLLFSLELAEAIKESEAYNHYDNELKNSLDNLITKGENLKDNSMSSKDDLIDASDNIREVLDKFNEIELAKQEAIENIESLKNVSDTKKEDFINRIDIAANEDEIFNIIKEAEEVNNANGKIKEFKYLSEDEKKDYINKIEDASDGEKVKELVKDADTLDLTKLKSLLKKQIDIANDLKGENYFDELDDQIKEDLDNILKVANENYLGTNKNKIKESIDELKKKIASVAKTLENIKTNNLNKTKKEAIDKINKLEYLLGSEKEDFINKVNSKDNTTDIDEVVTSAENQNEINKALEELNELIALSEVIKNDPDSYNNLTDDHKKDLDEKLNKANEVNSNDKELTEIKEAINTLSKTLNDITTLEKYKEEAINSLDQKESLSNTDKENVIKEIRKAKTTNEVDSVLDKANNLSKAKKEAIDKINTLEYLLNNEKETFINEVNEKTNTTEIDNVVTKAINQNEVNKALEVLNEYIALAETVKEAAEYDNVSNKQKESLENSLTKAKDIISKDNPLLEEINKASNELANIIEAIASLEQYKEATLIKLNNLDHLSEINLNAYKKELKEANNTNEVDKILEKANILNDNKKELNNTITLANKLINQEDYKLVNDKSKALLNDLLNKANNLNQASNNNESIININKELSSYLNDLTKLNTIKKEAIKKLNDLKLNKEDLAKLNDEIIKASDEKEVTEILNKALSLVNNHKAKLNTIISRAINYLNLKELTNDEIVLLSKSLNKAKHVLSNDNTDQNKIDHYTKELINIINKITARLNTTKTLPNTGVNNSISLLSIPSLLSAAYIIIKKRK